MNRDIKYCRVCGRQMAWRKKWRNNWAQVRYCSSACRQKGLTETDRTLEVILLDLLDRHRDSHGVVPEAAVDRIAAISTPDRQRALATASRNAARRLYRRGIVEILQKGRSIDPSHVKGTFRIRRRRVEK